MHTYRFYCVATLMLLATIIGGCGYNNSINSNITANDNDADEQGVLALLYQQHAAEYKALCLQAYNVATDRLDAAYQYKGSHKKAKRFAVVTDLDETALNNGNEDAWAYFHNITYDSVVFSRWCLMKKATALPGSVAFFKHADSLGFDIFYISNRDAATEIVDATMQNMQQLGFPQTDSSFKAHFIFAPPHVSSKEPRRQQVAETDSIIVLLGDNLIDLDAAFDNNPPMNTRDSLVYSMKERWGNRYIVLPNAVYGAWESALYKTHPATMTIKEKERRELLDTSAYRQ